MTSRGESSLSCHRQGLRARAISGTTGRFLQVWADDAAFMKQQPGFISTQLHQGTAGSTTFINAAGSRRSRRAAAPAPVAQ